MPPQLISCIRFLFLFAFLTTVNYATSQIQTPSPPTNPPEISGGAEAASLQVKALNLTLDNSEKPTPQVSSASSIIDAIDFATDGMNNSGSIHIPPDPHRAVGLNHVVNVVNTSILLVTVQMMIPWLV